jgi:hypothetical protein
METYAEPANDLSNARCAHPTIANAVVCRRTRQAILDWKSMSLT